jgi:hypothetical protein
VIAVRSYRRNSLSAATTYGTNASFKLVYLLLTQLGNPANFVCVCVCVCVDRKDMYIYLFIYLYIKPPIYRRPPLTSIKVCEQEFPNIQYFALQPLLICRYISSCHFV